jgi:hypothetical protein
MTADEIPFIGADLTPPHDLLSEQAVIGSCLLSPKVFDEVTHIVSAGDFYRPAHETLWLAMERMRSAGKPVDAVSVNAELMSSGELGNVGGAPYLHTLAAAVTSPSSALHYAAIVVERSRRRQLIGQAQTADQLARESPDAEQAIDDAVSGFLALQTIGQADDLSSLLDLDQFVDQPLPTEEWVIPELLAAGDRLVLTGSEGLGKSTLIRQLAVCAAAGLHPFKLTPADPRRVLVVDAENPKRIMVERFSALQAAAARRSLPVTPGRLWIDRRPDGLDLADVKDRRWLSQRVRTVKPDLLVIGPVYKLYVGGETRREEDLARLVTSVLDDVRGESALVLEHHSPHAVSGKDDMWQRSVRPIGSSLWLRWPEFGYGIRMAKHDQAVQRRIVEFLPWRGSRDERDWPHLLESGVQSHGWPWVQTIREAL